METSFFARFFDGQSIKSSQATVEVKSDRLEITLGQGSSARKIQWLSSTLEVNEMPHHGRPAVIGCRDMLGARLILTDESAFQAVFPLVPKHQIKRAGSHHPWRIFILLAVVMTLLLMAALWGTQLAAPVLARAIPAQWDDNLGKWTIEQVAGDHAECVAPEGQQALNKIMMRLSGSLENQPAFDVKVLEWGEVNAFAVPGHHIVLMSGLLHLADNPEEVAAVLAHEMGHAIEHHPTQSIFRQLGIKILITLAIGSTYDLASNLLILKYGRQDEQQADEIGLALLKQAQVDQTGMIKFFEKVAKMEGDVPLRKYWLDYLSSHPNTHDRIKNLQAKVIKDKPTPLLTKQEWQALRNICRKKAPLIFEKKE